MLLFVQGSHLTFSQILLALSRIPTGSSWIGRHSSLPIYSRYKGVHHHIAGQFDIHASVGDSQVQACSAQN